MIFLHILILHNIVDPIERFLFSKSVFVVSKEINILVKIWGKNTDFCIYFEFFVFKAEQLTFFRAILTHGQ